MSGKALREILGFLAVAASLAFVAMEIRQNTTVARAQERQALADASLNLIMAVSTDAELYADFRDWLGAEEDAVLDCDQTRMCIWMLGAVRHHENVFIQVREGIVDRDVFFSYGFINSPLYMSPYFPQSWPDYRLVVDPDFAVALEAEYDLTP